MRTFSSEFREGGTRAMNTPSCSSLQLDKIENVAKRNENGIEVKSPGRNYLLDPP